MDIRRGESTDLNCVAGYSGGLEGDCLGCREFAMFESVVPIGQFWLLVVGLVSQFRRGFVGQNTGFSLFVARYVASGGVLECTVLGVDSIGDQTDGTGPEGIQHLLGTLTLNGSKQLGQKV